jgi:tRNA (guanine-N7-)-methyltransferase
MAKHKLERFAENKTFPILFQHPDYDFINCGFPLKGKWNKDFFHNDNPIVIEVGCGRGEYTTALAKRFPHLNFVGIDRKGARLWRGCKNAIEQNLSNVAYLRIGIEYIEYFFGHDEVSEIWITFPDPQPNKENRRLVSPVLIEKYKSFLKKEGLIHLKTDSSLLYQYTLKTAAVENWKILENIENVYSQSDNLILTEIQTFYEKKWLKEDRVISYIKFQTS